MRLGRLRMCAARSKVRRSARKTPLLQPRAAPAATDAGETLNALAVRTSVLICGRRDLRSRADAVGLDAWGRLWCHHARRMDGQAEARDERHRPLCARRDCAQW